MCGLGEEIFDGEVGKANVLLIFLEACRKMLKRSHQLKCLYRAFVKIFSKAA